MRVVRLPSSVILTREETTLSTEIPSQTIPTTFLQSAVAPRFQLAHTFLYGRTDTNNEDKSRRFRAFSANGLTRNAAINNTPNVNKARSGFGGGGGGGGGDDDDVRKTDRK